VSGSYGLALDAAGGLFFAELGNAVARRISPTGIITTVERHLTATRRT
jgi:hypothetical protein